MPFFKEYISVYICKVLSVSDLQIEKIAKIALILNFRLTILFLLFNCTEVVSRFEQGTYQEEQMSCLN